MTLSRASSGPPRQGVILLVVVLMLALFLVVGLSFVLYAESEATASRIYRETPTDKADVPPEQLLAWALGQLIYPVPDDVAGSQSALRGHELARTMYAWNYVTAPNTLQVDPLRTNNPGWDPNADPTKIPYAGFANTTPFNGMGPLRFPQKDKNGNPVFPILPTLAAIPANAALTDYDLVNYTWYQVDQNVRDPEHPARSANDFRANPAQPFVVDPAQPALNKAPFAGGFNAPYTYPDRANMVLAAVEANDPTTNQPKLLTQSFFRPTANLPYTNPSNPNAIQVDPTTPGGQIFWNTPPGAANYNPAWKYLVLRPRPGDQLLPSEIAQGAFVYQDPADSRWKVGVNSGGNIVPIRMAFPPPADAGGDVKNLPGVPLYKTVIVNNQQVQVPLQNDSFWMDLGFPVQKTQNGLKYKPLFAFLVLDQDGRVNLNVAGNTALVTTVLDSKGAVAAIGDQNQNEWRTREHASNQGLGRHEINLSKILTAPATDPNTGTLVLNPLTNLPAGEWVKLFTGLPSTTTGIVPPAVPGRYGSGRVVVVNGNPINLPPQPSTRINLAPYSQEAAQARPDVMLDPYYPDWSTPAPGPASPRPNLSDLGHSLMFPYDFDAGYGPANTRMMTRRFNMPFTNFGSFPAFDGTQPGSFDSCGCTFDKQTGANTNDPISNHPLLNQVIARGANNVVFGDDNMLYLLAGDFKKSYLYGLIPNNLGGDGSNAALATLGNRVRQLVTTRSFDLDAPGAPPWVTSSAANVSGYQMPAGAPYPAGVNQQQPMTTPLPSQMGALAALAAQSGDYSDFKANDGRANLLGRIDLARKLTPYHFVDPTNPTNPNNGKFVSPLDPNNGQPIPPPPAAALYSQVSLATTPQSPYRYYFALYDRQQFAKDILDRLIEATGAAPLARIQAKTATKEEYAAVRYLAQLAVNMVDYIDDDDVITPFPWNAPGAFPWNPQTNDSAKHYEQDLQQPPDQPAQTPGWVYGTEAPKVLINEAYSELQNDWTDSPNNPQSQAASDGARSAYWYSFWLELYNPTPAANPPVDTVTTPGVARAPAERQDPDRMSINAGGQPIDPATGQPLPPAQAVKHDRNAAQLERVSPTVGKYPVYEVVILDEGSGTVSPPFVQTLSNPANTDGWLSDAQLQNGNRLRIQLTSFALPGSGQTATSKIPAPYANYFDPNFVEPTSGAFSAGIEFSKGAPGGLAPNQGFYVLAPDKNHPLQDKPAQAGNEPFTPTRWVNNNGATPTQSPAQPWGQPTGTNAQNSMTYQSTAGGAAAPPNTRNMAVQAGDFNSGKHHTVLLRRLACPGLDPNPVNPATGQPFNANKPFNPYITVDYMSRVPTNDAVKYVPKDGNGKVTNDNYMQPTQRRSFARRQPHAATLAGLTATGATEAPVLASFFKHNNQTQPNPVGPVPHLDAPFDWPVHLDRPPATVTELLHVSAYPPHLLTQRFALGQYDVPTDLNTRQLKAEARDQHLAPWQDPNARLYRALEFFTVGDRSPYPGTGGRLPGKVNPNTVFDRDQMDATIDARLKANPQANPPIPTPPNFFFENPPTAGPPATPPIGAVTDVWNAAGNPPTLPSLPLNDPANASFLHRKQQMLAGTAANQPDRPFMSLAAPPVPAGDMQYPLGSGLADTILPYQDPDPNPATHKGIVGTFTPRMALDPNSNPQAPSPLSPPAWPSLDFTPTTTDLYQLTYVQPPISPFPQALGQPLQAYQKQLVPPYVMNEMLNKISGHVTPRSNTFAVFVTVGFFEVIDDSTFPVKLGAEVTTSTGKAVRHQMFSVVDRTNLAIDSGKALDPVTLQPTGDPSGRLRQAATPPVFMSLADAVVAGTGTTAVGNTPAKPINVHIAGGIPTAYDGTMPVTFQTNQVMYLDMGANQEPVTVNQATVEEPTGSGKFVTVFQLTFGPTGAKFSHAPGATLCTYQPGNPGPQGPIDYTSPQYKAVVPYAYIIQ